MTKRTIPVYLANAERLAAAVNAYRAERGDDEPAPTKPKRLPPLTTPTEIPGFPLNPSPPAEVPDYGDMGRVQAIKRRQREVGRQSAMKPIGEPALRKRDSVSRGGPQDDRQ